MDDAGVVPREPLPYIVVMGVSGSGKSSTARLLAGRLNVPFADADDMHSRASIAKMREGIPLDDSDREPWLAQVGHWLHERVAAGTGGVVACSALKRRYRDSLRAAAPELFFVLLTADRDELLKRTAQRGEHFMPASLLDSQLAVLEPLEPDESGAVLHGTRGPGQAVDMTIRYLAEVGADDRD